MTEFQLSCLMIPFKGAAIQRCWAGNFIGTRDDAARYLIQRAAEAAARTDLADWEVAPHDFQMTESVPRAPELVVWSDPPMSGAENDRAWRDGPGSDAI